jgi:hypothetical protein
MTREQWLLDCLDALRPEFERAGFPLPEKIRASCSWPSKSALAEKTRRIGECWSAECSGDESFETFVSPCLINPVEVSATLVHELVHAAVGLRCKHRGRFKKCATAVGLEGKMTATHAGEELTHRLKEIADELGPYPHAKLDKTNAPKKQTCRQLKVECVECGCICRMSRTSLDEVGAPTCACGGEMGESE